MERDYTEEQRYLRAKEKVKKIKGFYANLITYCLVIPIIIYINLRFVPEFHWFWFSVFGWGMGLCFHAMDTFSYNPFLSRDWESKKIKEFMEDDEQKSNWE